MEEQAEAAAPARWKTLQLLIQPLTCSLSCVCLNVNSDCVRPRVKRTAVAPRFCPHLLFAVWQSPTVVVGERNESCFTFAGDTCGSKPPIHHPGFEHAPVRVWVWRLNYIWSDVTFFPPTIALLLYSIQFKSELGQKKKKKDPTWEKSFHFCNNLSAHKMWQA